MLFQFPSDMKADPLTRFNVLTCGPNPVNPHDSFSPPAGARTQGLTPSPVTRLTVSPCPEIPTQRRQGLGAAPSCRPPPVATSSSGSRHPLGPVPHPTSPPASAVDLQPRPTTSSFKSTASASSSILPPRPSPTRLPHPTPLRRTSRVRPHRLQNVAEVNSD
jgi:hypothetical protein